MIYVKKQPKSTLRTNIFKKFHNAFTECKETEQTIKSLDFFDMDEEFNDYICNHNKRFDLYLLKKVFKLVFVNEFHPNIKPEQ